MTARQVRWLLWEQSRRTAWAYGAALAAIVAGCAGIYWDQFGFGPVVPSQIEFVADAVLPTINLAIILYVLYSFVAFSDAQDLQITIPEYLLRLPISVSSLVAIRLACAVGAVMLLALLATEFVNFLFPTPAGGLLPRWQLPMAYGVFVLFTQTLAWTIGAMGIPLAIFVGSLLYIFGNWLIFDFDFAWAEVYTYSPWLLTGSAAGAYGLSVGAAVLQRRGILETLADFNPFALMSLGMKRGAERPFKGPEEALRWFEYRQKAFMLPRIAVFCFLCGLVVAAIATERHPYYGELSRASIVALAADQTLVVTYTTVIVAVFVASGLFFFQNMRNQTSEMKTFLFIRPVTTELLARARMQSVLVSVCRTLALLAPLAVLVYLIDTQHAENFLFRNMIDNFSPATTLFLAVLGLVGLFTVFWSVLWFGNVLLFVVTNAAAIFAVDVYSFFTNLDMGYQSTLEIRLTAVLMLALAAVLFHRAGKTGVLNRRLAIGGIAALPLFAVGFLIFANLDNIVDEGWISYHPLTRDVAAVLLTPLLPLATAPLAMHWARHR